MKISGFKPYNQAIQSELKRPSAEFMLSSAEGLRTGSFGFCIFIKRPGASVLKASYWPRLAAGQAQD